MLLLSEIRKTQFLSNHVVLYVISGIITIGVIIHQLNIQNDRKTDKFCYWWDWGVSRFACIIRIFMIAVDYFLIWLISLKTLIIIYFIYKLGNSKILIYNYFNQANFGGFSYFTNLIGNIILFFSILVFFSIFAWIFHKEQLQYKFTDKFLWWIYPIILIFLTLIPLQPIHKIMHTTKYELIEKNNAEISNFNTKINDIISKNKLYNKNTSGEINTNLNYVNYLYKRYEYFRQLHEWPFKTKTISIIILYILTPLLISLVAQLILEKRHKE